MSRRMLVVSIVCLMIILAEMFMLFAHDWKVGLVFIVLAMMLWSNIHLQERLWGVLRPAE